MNPRKKKWSYFLSYLKTTFSLKLNYILVCIKMCGAMVMAWTLKLYPIDMNSCTHT